MAQAKAKKEELVERLVIKKGIHCHNAKGERIFAKVGDTVKLPLRSAKRFAQYLEAPGVAAAKAEVAAVEAEAAGGAETADDAKPEAGAGGDS